MSYSREGMTEEAARTQNDQDDGRELDLSDPRTQELLRANPAVRKIVEENGRLFEQFRDQVDPRELAEVSHRSALHIIEAMGLDPLIEGLYNKRGFNSQLEREIERAKRSNTPLSVIILDADELKLINKTHGHLEGDRTIVAMGRSIKGNTRMNDIGARWGGDEFGIILPDTTGEETLEVAFRLLNTIPSQTRGLTVSVGVARLMEGDNAQSLFERTDKGQRAAKEFGKNQIVGVGLDISVDDLPKKIQGKITLLP